MQSAQLKDIRKADPKGQGRHSFTAQQQTLRRLSAVFGTFYDRCKVGLTPGYPRFKPYSRFDQVRSLVLLSAAGREVGVDVGVARFLTTSDGEIVANPRFLAASAAVITDLYRRTARARPGSGNRKRLRRSLAKEWRKIRNRRRDFHHKTARALVESCDPVALEKLNTDGTSRRPAPKPDPVQPGGYLPNGAAAKSRLNKSILDAGWAQFASILAAKAEEAGRRDADLNGARNIYARAGLGSDQARAA